MTEQREQGTVKCWFSEKGYGFISRLGGPDLFFHISDFSFGDGGELQRGTPVEFQVESTAKGLRAVDVTLVSEVAK